MKEYIIVYMSCFGTVEQTQCFSKKEANSVMFYLRKHDVAYPLYRIHVRLK
jgi:hypothetical protein